MNALKDESHVSKYLPEIEELKKHIPPDILESTERQLQELLHASGREPPTTREGWLALAKEMVEKEQKGEVP